MKLCDGSLKACVVVRELESKELSCSHGACRGELVRFLTTAVFRECDSILCCVRGVSDGASFKGCIRDNVIFAAGEGARVSRNKVNDRGADQVVGSSGVGLMSEATKGQLTTRSRRDLDPS